MGANLMSCELGKVKVKMNRKERENTMNQI